MDPRQCRDNEAGGGYLEFKLFLICRGKARTLPSQLCKPLFLFRNLIWFKLRMTMYLVCMIAESTVKPITVASDICNDCNLIFNCFIF